jgi:hypothetical protein
MLTDDTLADPVATCPTCGNPDDEFCSDGFHAPADPVAGLVAKLRRWAKLMRSVDATPDAADTMDAAAHALESLGGGGWQPIETDEATVERVAAAISCHTWATISQDNNDDCDDFALMPEYIKGIYRRAAHAAIAALKETTDAK